jgi:UDP-N-acetylmuramoyl-L-alanyl-D-glutamate--2,6-diaminopimelate ligase
MDGLVRPVRAPAPWAEPYFTVGVTGTNGKTSTTTLVASALRAAGHSVLSETTLGYALDDEVITVPRTVGGFLTALEGAAARGVRHAAIEVTSEALARGAAKQWRFDVGVFTNLSHDHLSSHGSWEHYLASKAQLFVHLGPGRTAVLNASDESALLLDAAIPDDVTRVWYAVPTRGAPRRPADLVAARVEVDAHGTRIVFEASPAAEQLGGELTTRLVGHVFAENAAAAALAALASNVPGDSVRRGIAECPVVPGRFETIADAPLVVVDYAHTPDALARITATARELADRRRGRLIVVFGAGGGRDAAKREPMGREVGARADHAIVTNDNPRDEDPAAIARVVASGARRGARAQVEVELDRRAALLRALDRAKDEDVVIVAGKGHENGQIIGRETLPFSDVAVLREILGGRGG